MKKLIQKVMVFLLVSAMLITSGVFAANREIWAASARVYISPYSYTVVTYKPGDDCKEYYSTIKIMGCTKASEIKNLKSSNKNMKAKAGDGYVIVYYGDKAQKTTITCTVKGVKLKTTLTVKKYTNPAKSVKIGKTNLTADFKKTNICRTAKKTYKNQKLDIKLKSGWKIRAVSVYSEGKLKNYSNINRTEFSKKVTIRGNYSYIYIQCVNEKTKITETLSIMI